MKPRSCEEMLGTLNCSSGKHSGADLGKGLKQPKKQASRQELQQLFREVAVGPGSQGVKPALDGHSWQPSSPGDAL